MEERTESLPSMAMNYATTIRVKTTRPAKLSFSWLNVVCDQINQIHIPWLDTGTRYESGVERQNLRDFVTNDKKWTPSYIDILEINDKFITFQFSINCENTIWNISDLMIAFAAQFPNSTVTGKNVFPN